VAEHAVKSLDIDVAGLSGSTGMCVDPDAAALLRAAAEIELLLEMLGHRHVIEGDVCLGTVLLDQLDLLHQQ
jgi:hypothetical protein